MTSSRSSAISTAPSWPSCGRRRRSRCCATATKWSDERSVAKARGRLDMAYGMVETQLTQYEFLAGDTFTIADCAAAPGLFYALAIHPWDERTHPQLTRYYRALAHRPSFTKVITDARPYRHLFPLPWPADFDRYH
jgi:glutathione S-transferase